MNMKQYKAVAGPKNINVGKGDTQSAFNTFAEIIIRQVKTCLMMSKIPEVQHILEN